MTAPFTDQGEAAVCARVAVALVKRTRKGDDFRGLQPAILIGVTVGQLDGLHFGTVRLALLSLSVWVTGHKQSDAWLRDVLYRDRLGFGLRHCFYSEYKANRRDPRVTNRGVKG